MIPITKDVHNALTEAHKSSTKLISKGKSASTDLLCADQRDKKNGWAKGNYENTCCLCGEKFLGDKRAVECADCAYGTKILFNT